MNKVLVDTDILSYFIKGDESVAKRMIQYMQHFDKLPISLITYYEILGGLEYKGAEKQKEMFLEFVDSQCEMLNITQESIVLSAKIYANLRKNGISISTADLLIAGIALHNNLILISNNTKHFSQVQELELENWKE